MVANIETKWSIPAAPVKTNIKDLIKRFSCSNNFCHFNVCVWIVRTHKEDKKNFNSPAKKDYWTKKSFEAEEIKNPLCRPRIFRLHLLQRIKILPHQKKMVSGYDTKLYSVGRLQIWSSGESGVTLSLLLLPGVHWFCCMTC